MWRRHEGDGLSNGRAILGALRILTFPGVLGGGVAAAAAMLAAGVAPFAVVLTVPPIAAGIIIALEYVIPFRRDWQRSRGDFRTDCVHLVLSAWAVESLPAVFNGALVAAATELAGAVGRTPWPTHWPLWAQLVLALVINEAFHYSVHRALHRFQPLWRVHTIHHSAERLYWLNATRVHPLEGFLHAATGTTVLIAAGASAPLLALYAVFVSIARLFQHANLDVRLGPLNLLFSATEVHRFHHSTRRDESEANYGTVLLVWDWLFGTRRAVPAASAPEQIGGPTVPPGWLGQVLSPFRRRMPEAAASTRESQ